MVLAVQFQNGVLARFPSAVTELAVFALASGVFGLFNANLGFVAQLTNVYARSPSATRTTYTFVFAVSTVLAFVLGCIGFSQWGADLVALGYGVDASVSERVCGYLRLLSGVVLLSGHRHFVTGLLVQSQLTGSVTLINGCYLLVVITALVTGLGLGWSAPYVLVGADIVGLLVHIGLSIVVLRKFYQPPVQDAAGTEVGVERKLAYRELLAFFIPVSMTGVMFAVSRPVLFAFVTRLPEGLLIVAALRVAFDFSAMFQQAANQFRHFFVTFGLSDLPRKRRFVVAVGAGITSIMCAFAFTPLLDLLWRDWMKIPEAARALSVDAFKVMCLMPVLILVRNYYHGTLMVLRRTAGMAWASVLRVIAIYFYAHVWFSQGWLDEVSAAFGLILGFAVETLVVMAVATSARAHAPTR